MSTRKRTPKNQSTETTTPAAEPPATEPPTTEAPIAEDNADGRNFAGKVGQKKWVAAPDPFTIARDRLANVSLFESKQDFQMAIQFGEGRPEDKPSQAVITTISQAGYKWNPFDRIWAHPVRPDSAMSTRIDAERLYQELCKMIRQEKGIEAAQEIPIQ